MARRRGPGPTYSPAVRRAALELYAAHGAKEAAQRLGIRRATVSAWASRAGISRPSPRMLPAIVVSREVRREVAYQRWLTWVEAVYLPRREAKLARREAKLARADGRLQARIARSGKLRDGGRARARAASAPKADA